MRILNFANRNFKEIIRDPLSIIFALLLPIFLLFIFQQFNIPSEVYKLENFTPSIIIFGFSFITLFTSSLASNDRSTSFLIRLGTSPMRPIEYILGYVLSVIVVVIIQSILFFIVAILLGLNININILYTIIVSIPISLLFVMLGILIGCVTSSKSAPGVSSVIVQLVAFTSGMYFSSDMVGKVFATICNILPFSRSLNIVTGVLNGKLSGLSTDIIVLLIYIILTSIITIIVFNKRMVSDNK